jgi:hypothetical protein
MRFWTSVGNSSTKPVMEESPVVRSQSDASINGAFNYSQRNFWGVTSDLHRGGGGSLHTCLLPYPQPMWPLLQTGA